MSRFRAVYAVVLFVLISVFSANAQSAITTDTAASEAEPAAFAPLPSGYENIELGADIDVVKQQLSSSPVFIYRGDPDVSMTPIENRQVIDCDGTFFVERGYFQFNDDSLYLITMVLDQQRIDHFSIYSAFSDKYGEPSFLDPSKAVWQNDEVALSLERPLSIKYIDRRVFQQLQNESYVEETTEELLRQDFIDTF